jgi:acetylornithine deacetylase/succinyl-diaminopimelate desuccinylase-like protein
MSNCLRILRGHLLIQPPMTETWSAGLSPYTPVIRDNKLYGRGGADDGYAMIASITAIKNLQLQVTFHFRTLTTSTSTCRFQVAA